MREKLEFSFLGESYSLPKDILTYVNEHHCFEQMRQEFLQFMLDMLPDCRNLPDNIESLIDNKFHYYANKCIKKLLDKDVYGITVEDYINENNGIAIFNEALKQYMLEETNALLEQINGFMEGTQEAEHIRDSQITGTGFSVITNNPIGFGVWAAMESSTLKKQAIKADAEFSSRIDSLIKQGESNTNSRIENFNANIWLPSIKNSVDTFIVELFNRYIDDLINNDKFDKEALNYNNISRAESILKNIANAKDKLKLLNSAFAVCPYCITIYIEAIQLQEFMDSIASTAKIFKIEKELYEYCKNKCDVTALNTFFMEEALKSVISPYCSFMSHISFKSFNEEFELCLIQRRMRMETSLKELLNMSTSKLDSFLRSNIDSSTEGIIQKCEKEGIESLVTNFVNNKILKGEKSPYYQRLKEKVIESVVSQIMSYIDEAKARYAEYQKQTEQFEIYRKEKISQIEELRSKSSKLGWFSSSKKKKIEEEISEIEKEIKEKNSVVYVALSRFNKMYS